MAEKQTPIHDIARSQGAAFVDIGGWLVVDAFGGEQKSIPAMTRDVALLDRSARAKVLVDGAAASAVVERAWDVPHLAVNGGAVHAQGAVYRLRHDRYFLSAPPGLEATLESTTARAMRQEDGLLTITDVTHGQAELWLLGPAAAELLSRLCGLDFHPASFPNLTARESSVAKTAQLVIRCDAARQRAYAIVGARSLGAYLWQTIIEAAHDLNLLLCGEALLLALESSKERDAGS